MIKFMLWFYLFLLDIFPTFTITAEASDISDSLQEKFFGTPSRIISSIIFFGILYLCWRKK